MPLSIVGAYHRRCGNRCGRRCPGRRWRDHIDVRRRGRRERPQPGLDLGSRASSRRGADDSDRARRTTTQPDPSLCAAVLYQRADDVLVVWRRSEFFFLDHYSTNTQIALYSISYSLVGAMVQLFEALTAVLTPAIATLYGAGEHERIRLGYGRALRLLLLLSLPLTTVMVSLGPAVLRLLGKEYRGTATVTVIMLATFPFVPLARAAYALLHGLGRVRFAIAAGTIATVANIVLDFLIIPGPDAAVGAAIANGGAQAIAAVPALATRSAPQAVSIGSHVSSPEASYSLSWSARPRRPPLTSPEVSSASSRGSVAALAAVGVFGPILKFIPPDDAAWLQAMLAGRMRGIPVRVLRRWAPRVASETVPSGGASCKSWSCSRNHLRWKVELQDDVRSASFGGYKLMASRSRPSPPGRSTPYRVASRSDLPVELIDVEPPDRRFHSFRRLRRPRADLAGSAFEQRVAERARDVDVVHLEETETFWTGRGVNVPKLLHIHYLARRDRNFGPPRRRQFREVLEFTLAERYAARRNRFLVASSPIIATHLRQLAPAAEVVLAPTQALHPAPLHAGDPR